MASGQAAPAAVQMQTVVLKVSIHCHGCKKKVRKVLRSLEGVHNVVVDSAQHKVTVTGTVDADTLVKRLYKSGKQALLLDPHAAPASKQPEAAPAPAPPPATTEAAAPAAAGDGAKDAVAADKNPEEPVKQVEAPEKKPEQADSEKKKPEAESSSKEEEKAKPSGEAKKDGGESEAAEPTKAKAAEPVKEAAKEVVGNDEGEPKKSKSKAPEDAAAGDAKMAPVVAATAERTLSAPPPKYAYDAYEQHYYYPPQPVLSYHAAQPRQSVSYYAPQPQAAAAYSMQQPQPGYSSMPPPRRAYSMEEPLPQQQEPMRQWSPSYLYMPYPHSAPESYYRQNQDYYSPPGSQAPPPLQDSYRMFDDENPNACSVM